MYIDKAKGCMIGAAFGDSLGASVEFLSLHQIRSSRTQINCFKGFYGHEAGSITDDTQMAIETAHGIINARLAQSNLIEEIHNRYLCWLKTQDDPRESRAPGSTCLRALQSGHIGTIRKPLNHSSGCGAVMRSHPIGIAFSKKPERAFGLGMQTGAITHGNPDGYVPAGFLAGLIACLNKYNFEMSLAIMLGLLAKLPRKEREGTEKALFRAMGTSVDGDIALKIDQYVGNSGINPGGWLGHDALAIAIYAIRCFPTDPIQSVIAAINHSGDSDSTGSIAGAIMGAIYGPEPFKTELSNQKVQLERESELIDVAEDLSAIGNGCTKWNRTS